MCAGDSRAGELLIRQSESFSILVAAQGTLCYTCVVLDNSVHVQWKDEWRATADLECSQSKCTEPLRVTGN